jgi:hypothetical protein
VSGKADNRRTPEAERQGGAPAATEGVEDTMRRFIVLCLIAAGAVAVPATQTSAATGTLSCRASALRIDTVLIDGEPIVANSPNDPCATEDKTLLAVPAPLNSVVTSNTLNARTGASATQGNAYASIENAKVLTAGPVTADVVEARARVECVGGAPVLSGSSRVANLKVNGVLKATLNAPPNTVVVNLPGGLLKVTINEQITGNGQITVRGVHVVSKFLGVTLADVILAEARANYHGAPCTPSTAPQCSDGVDNVDPEDTLADAADPGCHSDGDPNNPNTYVPSDNDETHTPPQCSDGVDNGDPEDTLADAADPGCHSDGDPNNPNTYVPSDNDETHTPPPPQCSDGVDNGDSEDALADAADPGCHTDGNPNNPDSYVPTDDDETNTPAQCSDGVDNTDPEDTVADTDDPGCHSDGDPENPDSYVPSDNDETDPPPTS